MRDQLRRSDPFRRRVGVPRSLASTAIAGALLLPGATSAQQAALARCAFDASPISAITRTTGFAALEPGALQRERSRTGRVVLQFLASSAGAAGVGLVSWLAFEDVGTRRVEGDAGYTRAGNVAYITGSFVGATLGAHLVGNSMGGRSPVWATAAGALVGTLPLFVFGGVDEPYLPVFGVILGWIPQGAFATIGYTAADNRR